MTKTLYISGEYAYAPQVYKNFYRAVIEPKLMDIYGTGKSFSSSVFLSDFNAHWDNSSKSIVFNTEQDLTFFLLRWA